jgi:hypothetical protein
MLAGSEEAFPGMNSVRILLAGAIDYAGMFPPAALALPKAVENYQAYRKGCNSWALGRFVAPLARAGETGLPAELLSVVARGSETAGTVEYLETTVGPLEEIKRRDARAKIRTGGVMPDLFPAPRALAGFLVECARLRLAFKATAGLHHAIRSTYKLTYDKDSPSATMHGFLNLLLAASVAWQGGSAEEVCATLEETDPTAFAFDDDGAGWHGRRLLNAQLAETREEFMISFGSCSFEEPLTELGAMGLL